MFENLAGKLGALALFTGIATVIAPGCSSRPELEARYGHGAQTAPGTANIMGDTEAATDARYASYFTQSSGAPAPASLDAGALGAEESCAETGEWMAADGGIPIPIPTKPKFECGSQFGCEYSVLCDEPTWRAWCVVTDCAEARCRSCPKIFKLDNLVFKAWCAYVCNDAGKDVGIAATIIDHFTGKPSKPFCVKL